MGCIIYCSCYSDLPFSWNLSKKTHLFTSVLTKDYKFSSPTKNFWSSQCEIPSNFNEIQVFLHCSFSPLCFLGTLFCFEYESFAVSDLCKVFVSSMYHLSPYLSFFFLSETSWAITILQEGASVEMSGKRKRNSSSHFLRPIKRQHQNWMRTLQERKILRQPIMNRNAKPPRNY